MSSIWKRFSSIYRYNIKAQTDQDNNGFDRYPSMEKGELDNARSEFEFGVVESLKGSLSPRDNDTISIEEDVESSETDLEEFSKASRDRPNVVKKYIILGSIMVGGFICGWDMGTIYDFIDIIPMTVSPSDFSQQFTPSINSTVTIINNLNHDYRYQGISSDLVERRMQYRFLYTVSSLGAAVGCILFCQYAQRFGRKPALLTAVISLMITLFLQAIFFQSMVILILIRVTIGVFLGALTTLCPLYIMEFTQSAKWNSMVGLIDYMNVSGFLIAVCTLLGSTIIITESSEPATSSLKPIFQNYKYITKTSLYIMSPVLIGCLILFVMGIIIIFFLPESPCFLISKGKIEKAKKSVARVSGMPIKSKYVQQEISEFKLEVSKPKTSQSLNKKEYRKVVFLSLLLVALAQFGGIFYLIDYFLYKLRTSEFNHRNLGLLGYTVLNVVLSLLSMPANLKWGKRKIMMFGSLVLLITIIIFASLGVSVIQPAKQSKEVIEIVELIMFTLCSFSIIVYNFTWAGAPMSIICKTFSQQARTNMFSYGVAFDWFIVFAANFILPYSRKYLGYYVGYFFAAFNLIALCVLFRFFGDLKSSIESGDNVDSDMEQESASKSRKYFLI